MDISSLEPKTLWLGAFVLLYWSYCIFWGIKGARQSKTASDYFIAGRGIGIWVFVLAATATSFSGWTFVGHPALIYTDGLQYAYASFYAITIPFTGVLFLKRQWMLGKHYGYVTPGEMFSHYFQGDAIRLLVVLVALCFSIPYLGVQLQASGFLFNILTDGLLGVEVGMWALSVVVFVYVATGGLRAVAYVDTMQCIMLAVGIIIIGVITLNAIGGVEPFLQGVKDLVANDKSLTADGYSHYVAIPGVIQFVSNGPDAVGGEWTGVMILTYMMALMGIQAAPAFTMWVFSNESPASFAPQQVWASSLIIGGILFVFTAIQGLGAHLIGLDAAMVEASSAAKVVPEVKSALDTQNVTDLMELGGAQKNLVPILINLMANSAPWLVGLLAVCALAAMQSTGAAYMSTASGMITRDLLKHFVMPTASDAKQKFWGRMFVGLIVLGALIVATVSTDKIVLLGGLAVAFGFQMWPALIAICYVPWFTRAGITWGLVAGIIAVVLTDKTNGAVQDLIGLDIPWGRNPLTMHSAFWGILANLSVAIIVSSLTQCRKAFEHRMTYHNYLTQHAGLPAHKRSMVPFAWVITLIWFFFAIGPGAVIGNTVFGDPRMPDSWIFHIPSIWAWQILWWILGVFMMWYLAYRMELSTVPHHKVEALVDDYAKTNP